MTCAPISFLDFLLSDVDGLMLVYLESFVFHYTLHNDAHADMIPLRYILKEPTPSRLP